VQNAIGKMVVRLYGKTRTVEVLPILAPRIMVLAREIVLTAGQMYRGKPLAQDFTIPAGRILHSKWIGEGEDKRRIYHVSASLYAVVRSYAHAIHSEEAAQRKLKLSNAELVSASRIIAKNLPLTVAQRKSVQEKLNTLQILFENARKDVLRSATARVEAALPLQDSLKRYNPGVILARLVAVGREYCVRFEEIEAILPNLARLHRVTAQELSAIWQILNAFESNLSSIARQVARGGEGLDMLTIWALCEALKSQLPLLKVDPFNRMATHMEQDLAYVFATLIDHDIPRLERAKEITLIIARMRMGIKFKRVQRELERALYRFSLALRKGTLTPAKQMQIIAATRAVMTRLGTLDESGFKVKRLAKGRALLWQGIDLMKARKFPRAKAQFKAASALL